MCHRTKTANHPYGGGDVPDPDTRDNNFEPHPQTSGDNTTAPEPLPESTRERRDGPGGE